MTFPGEVTRLGSIVADGHSQDSLFAANNRAHRHYPTRMHVALRDALAAAGIELHTSDVNCSRKADFEIHLEARQVPEDDIPRFLIALENPLINPLNAERAHLAHYLRVFTWNPRLFDLANVVPIRVPNRIEPVLPFTTFGERKRFACMINANKLFRRNVSGDLYLERLRTIRWYERHHPELFDLWGLGWGKPLPAFDLAGRVRRGLQRGLMATGWKPFPSWRGEVADKGDVYRTTRYAVCYENTRDLPGYVTEKIFDALVHGCVPVYWGPEDIADLVPERCFIDRRKFGDTAELHGHLTRIDEQQYSRFQRAIADWLSSEDARQFSDQAYAEVIARTIAAMIGASGQEHGDQN
jgi:hypothetical protein